MQLPDCFLTRVRQKQAKREELSQTCYFKPFKQRQLILIDLSLLLISTAALKELRFNGGRGSTKEWHGFTYNIAGLETVTLDWSGQGGICVCSPTFLTRAQAQLVWNAFGDSRNQIFWRFAACCVPPSIKEDVLYKCFPSPMFWLFSLPLSPVQLLRNTTEPTKNHFLSTGYEIICNDEWAEYNWHTAAVH